MTPRPDDPPRPGPGAGWRRVAAGGGGHARVQAELARELGASPEELAAGERLLDRLAARLRPAAGSCAADQLMAVGDVLAPALRRVGAQPRLGVDDLLLPRVLADGAGHAVAIAVAAAAAGHRAGLALDVVGASDGGLLLAHRELGEPYLLDPAGSWRFVRAGEAATRRLGDHGAALAVLDVVLARGRDLAQPWLALQAAELRAALPVDERTRLRLEVERRRERARLN